MSSSNRILYWTDSGKGTKDVKKDAFSFSIGFLKVYLEKNYSPNNSMESKLSFWSPPMRFHR